MIDPTAGRMIIAAPKHVADKLTDILSAAQLTPEAVFCTGEEALDAVQEDSLLLITYRLPDMTGEQLAEKAGGAQVLMIVPQDYAAAPPENVMILKNPVSQEALVQAVRALFYCSGRIKALREKARKLTRTLEERKVIDRAKGRLMDSLHLTEAEAHYRMQKKSMDTGRRIVDVALEILSAGENIAC